MISYNHPIILQKIIPIPNSRVKTLNTNPFLLLPAISGYYSIIGVSLDYDNNDVNPIGGYDWQIVNLAAYTLSAGNDSIMLFGWNNDTKRRAGVMQGISGNCNYIRSFRDEPIYLYSNQNDALADFNYANINIVYTQNS
jgi:hypothetical protein